MRRFALLFAVLTVVAGGTMSGWWIIGDLTESGVVIPNYMVREPVWIREHPRLIGVIGMMFVASGIFSFLLLSAGPNCQKSCSRQIALSVFLLLDGIYFGLILRMLTIGAEGANFAGITLLVGIPSVLIVTVVLLVKATRVALPHSEGMS
jgi:hypothetical protein